MYQVYSYGLFFYFENTNILWYNTAYLSVSNKGDARVEKLKKYLEPVLVMLVFFYDLYAFVAAGNCQGRQLCRYCTRCNAAGS